jgi:uncharacterized protein with NRDE domain
MCLVALAIEQSPRFPLVVAANRDEYFERPSAPLGWWSPAEGSPEILGGRDLKAGGTWFGVTAAGRMALVTNVREPKVVTPPAPTRGELVPLWLRSDGSIDTFAQRIATAGYAGVNVIAGEMAREEFFYLSNRTPGYQRLGPGIYGLSNATLDTPWPKVTALEARLADALTSAGSVDALCNELYEALFDDRMAAEELLPNTGVPLDVERRLSSAFIRMPPLYGTRCSTVMIRAGAATYVFERSFGPDGAVIGERRIVVPPPG